MSTAEAPIVSCRTCLVELEIGGQQIVVTEALSVLASITTDEINQISVHPKTRWDRKVDAAAPNLTCR